MNKLTIKELRLKNFRSYGNAPQKFVFPEPGKTMLVEGDVGAGKSSIIDGIVYAMVGSRAFPKSVVNCISKKNCLVEGDMVFNGKDLEIVRGTKPSKFNVTGLGKSVNQDLQARLDQLIHITSKQALYNICLLSSSKTLPFFSLDKQERLKFLRNFVDSTVLDALIKTSKSENSALKLRCVERQTRVSALGSNVEKLERMIRETLFETQEAQTKLENEQTDLEARLGTEEELKEAQEKLMEFTKERESHSESVIQLRETSSKVQAELAIHKAAWDEVKSSLPAVSSADEVLKACEVEITKQSSLLEIKEKLTGKIENALNGMPTKIEFEAITVSLAATIKKHSEHTQKMETECVTHTQTQNNAEDQKKQLMSDQERIESEECSAYFEKLIEDVDAIIDTEKVQFDKTRVVINEIVTKQQAVEADQELIDEKFSDFCKLEEALAENEESCSDLESSIAHLKAEKDTFIRLITKFLNSEKEAEDASIQQAALQSTVDELTTKISSLETLVYDEEEGRSRLENVIKELENLNPNVDKMREELVNSKKELEDAEVDEDELRRTHILVKEYVKILDEVWAYITHRIIPQLNAKLPHYTEELGLGFSMKIDPKNIAKPLFSGRPGINSLSLKEDLSDGQKRLISMALAHSLRDMEASVRGIEIGWLVIDEFSNSLSPHRVEHVMNFEKRFAKANGISLIVISHDIALKAYDWDHLTTITRDTYSHIKQTR